MKASRAGLSFSCAIVATACVGTPAYAQVKDIVVTAQKRTQSDKDVPISLQVVSGNDLQNNQIADTEQLADSLPNVFVSKDSVSNNIYMRGVGSGANAGFEQAVATFVDGVYHGRSRYSQSTLVDVDHIEVLRGPQTIYFGNNAIGGAFSVTTKRPNLSNWDGYAQASYEFVGKEPVVEAAVGGPLITDKLAIRVAGYYSHLNGYIKNTATGRDDPDTKDRFVRGTVLWRLDDAWEASFKAEYGKQDGTAPFPVQLTTCPPDSPFSAAATFSCGYALATGQEAKFDYRRASNPGEIGSNKAWELVSKLEKDNDNGPGIVVQAALSRNDFLLSADTDATPGDFFTYNTIEKLNQKTLEMRLTSPAASKIDYILGFYYLDSKTSVGTTLNFPFATALLTGPLDVLAPYAPLSGAIQLDEHEKAMSMFGSVTYPITDRLSLIGGLRYTQSHKVGYQSATNATAHDTYGFSVTPLPEALQPVAALLTGFNEHDNRGVVDNDDFLPSATLQYEPNKNLTIYAKYSRGFKAGGFDAVELTGIPSRLSFKPETVNAYETGLKSFLFDRTVSFDIALFRSNYSNLQQSVAQFTATSAYITVANVGGLRSQGIEAELTWRPSNRFELGTNLALLDAKYQNYPNGGCDALQAYQAQQAGLTGCSQDLSGRSPPFAPDYSGNVHASYNIPIGNSLQFSIDGTLNFSGSYYVIADLDPHARQPAWQKVDVRVAIGNIGRGWSLAFVGRNLTNVKVMGSQNDIVASAGSYATQIQRGRTLAAQARFSF